MYQKESYDLYLSKLREAMTVDEAAGEARKKGARDQAADEYAKASVLYAQAANSLLDVCDGCNEGERKDFEKSVERLTAIARQVRACAEELRRQPSQQDIQAEEEDQVLFRPAEAQNVTFDDIAGLDEAKQMILDEIIHPSMYRELYDRFKMDNSGGLLLFGPPGGGKTMIARAVAAEANLPFFSARCSDIVGKYFGEAEKHVRALFEAARKAKNAVIFLDEAEALACRRGGHSTVMNRLVPELLSQMDGFEKFDGRIIVIFATNRPYDIDPAFLRHGRLPSHCYVPLPDENVRTAFLKKMIAQRPCSDDVDIGKIVQATNRFSCADLVNLVRKSCQYPINRSIERKAKGEQTVEEFLCQQDIEQALSRLHPSVEPEEIERLEKWMKKMGMQLPQMAA